MHHPTDRIAHTTAFVTPVMEHWLERETAQWVHSMKDRSDDPSHHELHLAPPSGDSTLTLSCSLSHMPNAMFFILLSIAEFSFQPVLHDWCNKGRGMCYPVCGMVHIKEPLLLIDKSSPCGGSGFPFSLSEWSLTICPTPYNCR